MSVDSIVYEEVNKATALDGTRQMRGSEIRKSSLAARHSGGLNPRYNDARELLGVRDVKNADYQRVAFFFSPLYSRNRDTSRLSSAHAGVVTSYRLGEVSSFPHMAPEAL